MTTIYQADCWCDDCGLAIREALVKAERWPKYWTPGETTDAKEHGVRGEPLADSDDWPGIGYPDEPSDSPRHCAAGAECLNALDLRAWGLGKRARMVGAETPLIGALLGDELTEYGADYLHEMLAERPRTPYQRALHRFWRAAFADYL